jgi:hypothetical protein
LVGVVSCPVHLGHGSSSCSTSVFSWVEASSATSMTFNRVAAEISDRVIWRTEGDLPVISFWNRSFSVERVRERVHPFSEPDFFESGRSAIDCVRGAFGEPLPVGSREAAEMHESPTRCYFRHCHGTGLGGQEFFVHLLKPEIAKVSHRGRAK